MLGSVFENEAMAELEIDKFRKVWFQLFGFHLQKSKLRFLDTMSMHIATCGLTSFQRVLYQANKKKSNLKAVSEFKQKQRQRGIVPVSLNQFY